MAKIYYITSQSSDISAPTALLNTLALDNPEQFLFYDAVIIGVGAYATASVFTPIGEPGINGSSEGLFRLEVYRMAAAQLDFPYNDDIITTIRLHRVNSLGVIQNSSDTQQIVGKGIPANASGSIVFEFVNPSLGNWTEGDRLRMDYIYINTGSVNNATTIFTGTYFDFIRTPFYKPSKSYVETSNTNISNNTYTLTKPNITANTPELLTTVGSGTWTKPAGVTLVMVECWGAGGAGGGATGANTFGNGGAGGAYARSVLTYPSESSTISYFVGAGGVGGTGNGSNGQDTTWDANIVVAKGSQGATANNTELSPGTYATGSLNNEGQIKYIGGWGSVGSIDVLAPENITTVAGGTGGGGAGSNGSSKAGDSLFEFTFGDRLGEPELGGDGGDNPFVTSNGGANGNAGLIYGGGGSGAAKISGANRSGGNGAQGLIRITTYNINNTGNKVEFLPFF